ncbi:MAG TPA: hypothetical protein VGJ36_04105 [Gemmatimonadales bacterium]|jgi:hypothetical protein
MARLFWLLLILAFVGALLMGTSWAVAYYRVGDLLGAPPPQMGTQSTSIEWHGLSRLREYPPMWRFAFAPTVIPGASTVRIYVSPWGQVVSTEPPDLEARVKAFHNTGY